MDDDLDLIDDDLDNSSYSPERPTFLTVLCILTWIGSALGIFGAFSSDNSLSQVSYTNPTWYSILMLACSAATAVGAYMMWNLKKKGLLIYTAGEVISVIAPFILFFVIVPPEMKELSRFGGMQSLIITTLVFISIFPIAFIIMYWSNAKHLTDD